MIFLFFFGEHMDKIHCREIQNNLTGSWSACHVFEIDLFLCTHLNVLLIGCICIKSNKKHLLLLLLCSTSVHPKKPFFRIAWLLRAGLASSKQLPSLPLEGNCCSLGFLYLNPSLSLSLSLSLFWFITSSTYLPKWIHYTP
jgi:hypothetical protein